MDKRRFKHLALLMLAAIPLIASAQRGTVSYTATYDSGKLAIGTTARNGVTYSTVEYNGLFNDIEPGALSLPVDYIRFSVPINATNFSVSATAGATSTVELDYPVDICPQEADNVARNDDSERPAQLAWYVDEGLLAGENHIVTIAIAPVASGTGNVLRVNGTVNVTLSYELSETPRLTPRIRRGASLRAKGHERTQTMVVNPDDVVANAASTRMGVNRDDELTDPETYLIVTTEDMLHPLRRLAALKRQKGIPVKVVTMTEVLNDPIVGQGDVVVIDVPELFYDDAAGKLRQYLKNQFYELGTEYVLLAGSDVPNRNASDLYFSELDSEWMSIFMSPCELYVGRLLGTDAQEFVNYVDKLLMYELNPGNGDYSYLQKSLLTEGQQYITLNGLSMSNIFTSGIFINVDECEYFTGSDVIDTIRCYHPAFWGSMNYGTPSYIKIYDNDTLDVLHYIWAIDTAKVSPDVIDTENGNGLNLMQNRYYPMISYNILGQTMPYTTVNGYYVDMNYGESFTMGKDYGGPAFFGNTSQINSEQARILASSFAHVVNSGKTILGKAMLSAKDRLPWIYFGDVKYSLNYLGDPILDIWSAVPQTYSGITVTRNNNSVTVNGVPTSTTVSYYSNDGAMGSVTASSSTVTLSGISPNSSIMLNNHNYIPYIAPLVLQNVTLNKSQYVIAGSVLAGKTVDSSRTYGQVTVSNNTEYEIEAAGEVKIAGGFKVEKGAYFAITPASYK